MIKLTKLNNDVFVLNDDQIQAIEMIPESKVIMMNKEFFVVKESCDEIIERITHYNAVVWDKRMLLRDEQE